MIYQVIIACMDGYHSLVKCLFYAHVSPDSDDVWNRKAGLQLNELFDFYSAFVLLSIIERNEIYSELSTIYCSYVDTYVHNSQKKSKRSYILFRSYHLHITYISLTTYYLQLVVLSLLNLGRILSRRIVLEINCARTIFPGKIMWRRNFRDEFSCYPSQT